MAEARGRILIVDDEKDFSDLLFYLLKEEGFSPVVAQDGDSALEMIRLGIAEAVLLDVKMPGIDGMEVLKRSKKLNPNLPILMITAHGGIDGAVKAMKLGAQDYLTKPINNKELVGKVRRALENKPTVPTKLKASDMSPKLSAAELQTIMGPSEAVTGIISDIMLVAPSNFTVVIQGETGTGKELIARTIHKASRKSDASLVPVDCGAIPESLFESELFGHEKGAYTGAISRRAGKFEIAQGGTLFLDEIANMPLGCQIKLLRAIQERSFCRVGGNEPVSVDVRLLIATNRDLNQEIRKGAFSRDLFYRLSEFSIVIPPLRERKEDIVHLANRFLQATNFELGKSVRRISDSALQALLDFNWPGNVRQLRSVIRRAVLRADELINLGHLNLLNGDSCSPVVDRTVSDVVWEGLPLKEMVRKCIRDVERRVIADVLRRTAGNKAKAARLLQIDYKTIHSKIKQYDIKIGEEDEDDHEEERPE